MTSLIDVIFLLLLFFMLSSTFARQGELPLDLAMGGAANAPETPPTFVQLHEDGLRLDAVPTTANALRASLAERDEGLVLLALGEGVSAQAFAEMLHLLQGLPGWRLAVLGAAR
ncbi:biopolymer transporter ExbD [Rhodobacteraceae bacterium 2376]|uniref:Biopolymer transporter ExbD n=2 Tax=Rhabdonatronobacter sediminivivens TaxID=2743469 RepID=A0A7Z0I1G7_9RHOB|nr:biopolymer transporter ExbD [Rhabdonatronobacter sediminivivens]